MSENIYTLRNTIPQDPIKQQLLDHVAQSYDEFILDGKGPVFLLYSMVDEDGFAGIGHLTVGLGQGKASLFHARAVVRILEAMPEGSKVR